MTKVKIVEILIMTTEHIYIESISPKAFMKVYGIWTKFSQPFTFGFKEILSRK